jgi:hypothetical protein
MDLTGEAAIYRSGKLQIGGLENLVREGESHLAGGF